MNIYAEVLKKMDKKCQNLSKTKTVEMPVHQSHRKDKENEEINAIVKSIR